MKRAGWTLALSLAIGVAVAPPSIIDLAADDPDESDLHFAEFDTLDVLFDRPTSMPGGPGVLDRQSVDALLSFSTPVHAAPRMPPIHAYRSHAPPAQVIGDYYAHWNTSALLRIIFGVVDATSAPTRGEERVGCRAGGGILPDGAADAADACTAPPLSPPLRGSWGYAAPSSVGIASLVGADPDDGDEVFGVNDTLTIGFTTPTNRGGVALGAAAAPATLDDADVRRRGPPLRP